MVTSEGSRGDELREGLVYSFLYLKLSRGAQVFVIIRLHFVLSVLYFIMYKTKNYMNVDGLHIL